MSGRAEAEGEAELEELRRQIARIDEQILGLVGQRLKTSLEVARAKHRAAIPIRNFRVEVEVLARARRAAQQDGFDPELAQQIMRTLIEASVATQRDYTIARAPARPQHRITVVGGGGRMGSWLCHFFTAQGHAVSVCDPASVPQGYPSLTLEQAVASQDVVVLAAPLGLTPQLLAQALGMPGRPVMFDICSLKGHLTPLLREAAGQGHRVTSLHPMFAPGPAVLSGRALLVCDAGQPEATRVARSLFSDTALGLCDVPLEEHDRIMSVVLGMSHALNLIFALSLARCELDLATLGRLASNTFSQQIQTTAQVAGENPVLYHEIQALNQFTPRVYELLSQALESFRAASSPQGQEDFLALMQECRRFFGSDSEG